MASLVRCVALPSSHLLDRMNDVLFDERCTAEGTTDEKQNRQGSTLSGLFLKFSSETDDARTGDVVCLLPALHQAKNDAGPTEIATNGERQKLDTEQRTSHNPKRGSHMNWVGASMVCRGDNDILTLFLGRLSGLIRQPQTSRTQQSHHPGSSYLAIPSQGHPPGGILHQRRSTNTPSCFTTSRVV